MAIVTSKLSVAELRRKLGKTVVVCDYGDRIIIRSRPNHNSKYYKNMCIRNRNMFTELHRMAGLILSDPVKKAEYEAKCGPLQTARNVLVGELIKNFKSISDGDSIWSPF